ncbi:DSBA-like thioredoxin domain [Seminavis robusta]|uniref:DSBA-like thioredoxin domain n=1 Tax=Seminavis robusta TaxID=568900 RepID=A0A9N8EN34_9STRA|nr:DSBA-like thioredoxin domain [Seminavis robusta]|eukprot:Sro1499_g277800.1 DSBA-like thioredoxin domain (200) ;mRNA; r:24681-25280
MAIAVDDYKTAPKALPISIEWKPFMIDPGTKREGEEYLAYNRRRWGGDGWTHSMKREGRKIGANFDNWKWWPNTTKAHQLVSYFAQRGGDTSRSNQALFEALYEEGKNLSLIDTLVEIAVEKLDLPPSEREDLRAFLAQDKAANEVQHEIDQGRRKYRISGVPYFVIGKKNRGKGEKPYGFSGAQPPETFLEIFQELEE